MTQIPDPLPDFVLSGLREILGDEGLASVTASRGVKASAGSLGGMLEAIADRYGEHAGQGIALRAGSAAFKYFQTQYSEQLQLTTLEMRTRPLKARLREGLKSMAACLRGECGWDMTFEEREGEWFWVAYDCPECVGRKSASPSCYFTVGLIQEFMGWSAGSKFYLVEEIACAGRGDGACEFRIASQPLD